jgi:hypothetical protein
MGLMDAPPVNATQAQKVSLRRAVRSLERKGLLETFEWEGPGLSRKAARRIGQSE